MRCSWPARWGHVGSSQQPPVRLPCQSLIDILCRFEERVIEMDSHPPILRLQGKGFRLHGALGPTCVWTT